LPEINVKEYYYHFHTIEDLYNELHGTEKHWKKIEGDINVNVDLQFKVYTARWGHEDNYSMESYHVTKIDNKVKKFCLLKSTFIPKVSRFIE